MNRTKKTVRPKLLAACVSTALLGMYSSAYGVVISTTADASVGATTVSHALTTTDGSTSNSNANVVSGLDSSTGGAFGKGYGAFAVHNTAGGAGAAANSSVEFIRNISNTTTTALHFTYSFYLYGGYISTNVADPLSASETLAASYAALISYGGSSIWSSSASVARSGSASSEAFSGVSLATDSVNDGYYSWAGQTFTLDLGVLNPGEDRDIITTLSGSAASNVGVYSYCFDGSGYYGGGTPTCYDFSKGYADMFYGDPSGAEGLPIDGETVVISSAPVDVPEPGTLLLLGAAGLAGAVTRRRFV